MRVTKKIGLFSVAKISIIVLPLIVSIFGYASLGQFNNSSGVAIGILSVPCSVSTYGDAWDGSITFGLWNFTEGEKSCLVIMNTDGEVKYVKYANGSKGPNYEVVKPISQEILMHTGSGYFWGGGDVHFLNLKTNETLGFPGVITHHDVEYNPITNTFLTLQCYVKEINGQKILFDKVVKLNSTGYVLWTWDTYDHIPISETCPFNDSAVINGQSIIEGESIYEFLHCNTINWNYNQSIIYLNSRYLNTFYKINETSGDIIWSCGEHGDFKLLDTYGKNISSLWYHSHSTREVEPGVFIMFDNDYHNQTNPNNAHSRMIEVTLNEKNMTAGVSWSWTAPKDYWSPHWGIAERLPNGDRLGVFGTETKQYNDSIGAVIIEVNSKGQLVRTWTFPRGWGIYRVEQMPSTSTYE